MSKRRRKKRSLSQVAFQIMGITLVIFMVFSLVLVSLPQPAPSVPTAVPFPTFTPIPRPTDTPAPPVSPSPEPTLEPTVTMTVTEAPIVGPQLPTETPPATPTPSADAAPPAGDSRDGPQVAVQVTDATIEVAEISRRRDRRMAAFLPQATPTAKPRPTDRGLGSFLCQVSTHIVRRRVAYGL